jgi:hypothetical protein
MNRLKENNNIVDELIPNNKTTEIFDKYKFELQDYKYIDNVIDFSLLRLRGSLRYIKKYSKELRYGGLLIKIYQKNDDWYGIIKKVDNKKYHISFKNNFIFYYENKDDKFKDWAKCFISQVENGFYEIN